MSTTYSPETLSFANKLEAFSGTLTPHEREVFKTMLERRELSERDLAQISGGAGLAHLGSSFFSTHVAMCW
jgi:bacteriocin-like protein